MFGTVEHRETVQSTGTVNILGERIIWYAMANLCYSFDGFVKEKTISWAEPRY
jgi:hypothetical protein